jgi:hypothetical protein
VPEPPRSQPAERGVCDQGQVCVSCAPSLEREVADGRRTASHIRFGTPRSGRHAAVQTESARGSPPPRGQVPGPWVYSSDAVSVGTSCSVSCSGSSRPARRGRCGCPMCGRHSIRCWIRRSRGRSLRCTPRRHHPPYARPADRSSPSPDAEGTVVSHQHRSRPRPAGAVETDQHLRATDAYVAMRR